MNYIITNREILDNGNIREDGKEHAGDNLRFGTYNIETKTFQLFPEPKKTTDVAYDNISEKDIGNLKGSSRFFVELYQNLTNENFDKTSDENDKTDVLFFIHGFNTDLNGVRDNFNTLHEKYVENKKSTIKHLVIFSWPGKDLKIPLHYHDDKKDAIRSGETLARGFKKLEDFFRLFLVQERNVPCNRKIHLMVHSMGHRVLKHMLLELDKVPCIFDQILLMAADIEYDIFHPDKAFFKTIDLGNRVHVFYNKKDKVLDISKYLKNFDNRLGRYGRKQVDPGLIDVYDTDTTKTKDDSIYGFKEDALNHWYYYSCKDVVDDVISIFKGNKSKFIDTTI